MKATQLCGNSAVARSTRAAILRLDPGPVFLRGFRRASGLMPLLASGLQVVCFLLVSMPAGRTQEIPAARPASSARAVIDLSGQWEFRMDPDDRGRAEKWFEIGTPFDRKIAVPGAWNAQGVRYESENLLRAYEARELNTRGVPASTLGPERESDRLFNVFPGPAWYRRTIEVPAGWQGRVPWLVFGGVHRFADVWVNGHFAGSHNSYLTPFRFELSKWVKPGEKANVTVRVDARRDKAVDPLMGCMDTLDFVYVSWGGIHRPVTLEASGEARIENVFAVPHLSPSSVDVRVTLSGRIESALPVVIEVQDANGTRVGEGEASVSGEATMTIPIPEPRRWSPSQPHLYTVRATLAGQDAISTRFGLREFKVEGGKFLLNGRPIWLRGYGDDCIFPNTIAPPADKEEYRRRLSLARDYGFNYVRHHSWMPVEEYLDVADELGMMIQPEFPIAYRWDLAATPATKQFYLGQWQAMIRLNRNHPCIVTWCMGNEIYDSFEQAPEMYRLAKELDPTRPVIDSDGCNWKHQGRPTLDFLVVQFNEGSSIGFQDGKYSVPAGVGKPVVCHEMGYFVTLHDLAQAELFTGGLRPYWLLQTRELATKHGVSDLYPQWLQASYRLQAVSLKNNIEAARRSRLSGMSVWLFHDYPNCAEGVVDMFWRPKGISASEFRAFNAPTVLLLDVPRRNFHFDEMADIKLLVSRFEDKPTENGTLRWELRAGTGTLATGMQENLRVTAEGVQELAALSLPLARRAGAEKLTLAVELRDENGVSRNEWNLWLFPNQDLKLESEGDLVVTSRMEPETLAHLEQGGRVLLLSPESVFETEKTNFRLSSWDGGGPSGTVIDRNHPALRAMPHDGWGDLQFYALIQGSKTVSLDPLPGKIQPLVRCIDRPQRLANRAYLFEAAVGKGRLLVSGFNFAGALAGHDPAAAFLKDQLVRYALGPDFAPTAQIPAEYLRAKLKK